MAKLPQIRKVLLEDVKSQKSWIQPLLLSLNTFMEQMVAALNKNLTIGENTTGQVDDVTLAGAWPVNYSWTKSQTPVAVIVGNVVRADGSSFTLSSAVQPQWAMSADGKSVQISGVTGITPSGATQYVLTLVTLTG